MITEAAVREALDDVIDPCSAAAGAPAGLTSMGIVSQVAVSAGEHGATVRVRLLFTHPFCMMAAVLVNEARARIAAMPGVAETEVGLEGSLMWTPDRMTPSYRAKLESARRARA